MYEENNNNNILLWIIAVVNILTLILLATFFAMSWNVINADDVSQNTKQEQSTQKLPQQQSTTNNQQLTQPPANQQPTGKPAISASEKECMDKCVQGGEMPPKCAEECGIELPPKR